MRSIGKELSSIGHVRFAELIVECMMIPQSFFVRHINIHKYTQFKVRLETLTRPERATVAHVREQLVRRGVSIDIMDPSKEYLQSMHYPAQGPHAQISNIPEEVGRLEDGGIYTLKGEWFEYVPHVKDSRPRSPTVALYFHGGGHAFCHQEHIATIGPGARIFAIDYRMGPEHPFPAAIHDAFAAYLYLVDPNHEALILNDKSEAHHVPVDPRDIVVGGDSAGANLAAAFMLYLANYVQPSVSPKFIWGDPTSSFPVANHKEWYCYCPGPIGSHPYDKSTFTAFKGINLGRNYVLGDVTSNPNARNALGEERAWDWYFNLAQHPLVSPVHRANLSGLTFTLVQTGTHDRLYDDNRLYAHRFGLENPNRLVRFEVYKDIVHVHQLISMLEASRTAFRNMARFIERSRLHRDVEEGLLSPKQAQEAENRYLGLEKDRSLDNVEWVTVEANGNESIKDSGRDLAELFKVWPLNESLDI
ncbi:hypothetical protein FBU30_006458 [Linnemannia zychae]|nr:hypothetical protein FBU30_006458 [Linnemannia zychae]